MNTLAMLSLFLAPSHALVVAPLAAQRTASNVQMGLAVGEKFPASALKSCGVSGKKAVIFFYGADDA